MSLCYDILEHVAKHATPSLLAMLCRVCRDIEKKAIPLLYTNVVIDRPSQYQLISQILRIRTSTFSDDDSETTEQCNGKCGSLTRSRPSTSLLFLRHIKSLTLLAPPPNDLENELLECFSPQITSRDSADPPTVETKDAWTPIPLEQLEFHTTSSDFSIFTSFGKLFSPARCTIRSLEPEAKVWCCQWGIAIPAHWNELEALHLVDCLPLRPELRQFGGHPESLAIPWKSCPVLKTCVVELRERQEDDSGKLLRTVLRKAPGRNEWPAFERYEVRVVGTKNVEAAARELERLKERCGNGNDRDRFARTVAVLRETDLKENWNACIETERV